MAGSRSETRPSTPRAILVTREQKPGADPLETLSEAGHSLRYLALSIHRPLPNPRLVREAIGGAQRGQWIAVTSARAVEALDTLDADATPFFQRRDLLWACVGPASARAVSQRTGRPPDLVSEAMNAADLGQRLTARLRAAPPQSPKDQAEPGVIFFCAANARADLPEALLAANVPVDIVVTYETTPRVPSRSELDPPAGQANWDAIVLTSGLAVHTLVQALGQSETPPRETPDAHIRQYLMQNHPVVLGETAEAALRQYGTEPWLRSPRPTMEDLARTLLQHLV